MMYGVYLSCAAVTLISIIAMLRRRWTSKRPSWPRDTVVLHQLGRGPWAPSLSPFPLKLETYLRMAKIPYVNDHAGGMSPKGKTPWITYNEEDLTDSQLSIDYLNKKLDVDLNKHLLEEERGVAKAFQRLTEENLYWTMCAHTFGEDLSGLEALVPYKGLKKYFICRLLRYRIQSELWGQGIGRHSLKEVTQIGYSDLKALSSYLGSKPYLMGSEPCEQDCAVFAMIAQVMWHMRLTPHRSIIEDEFPNLSDYCNRMKERYWPDWDECITHGYTRDATK